MVEVADSLCMAAILVYAVFPSFEDSLKQLNLFLGIIYSLFAARTLKAAHQRILYCRLPHMLMLYLHKLQCIWTAKRQSDSLLSLLI
jgi:multisubunit Na+/H+ antiporter MnhE subunit